MDMDKYIKKRRTTEYSTPKIDINEKLNEMKQNMNEWKVFSLFRKKEAEYDEEDYDDEETEIEEIDDVEEELEERRESALRRFFKKLRRNKKRKEEPEHEEYDEETEEDTLNEAKEIIKITHKWLEELPPETIERFRRSEDYVKYKETLRKLKMIK